jgi:hypothetical protein
MGDEAVEPWNYISRNPLSSMRGNKLGHPMEVVYDDCMKHKLQNGCCEGHRVYDCENRGLGLDKVL